jgi:CxxC-x17-CxxC domain-containing protein
MYKTTCSNCGKDCEIPFVPTGDRPVFCSECFEKMGGSSSSRRFRDMGDRQPRNDVQLEAISTKLDKILKILTPVSPPQIVVAKKKTS